ncbi:MAG: YbjN domain-containing protein [Blastocatellia bacterium]
MKKYWIPPVLAALLALVSVAALAQEPTKLSLDKASAGKIVQMLEESGAGYAKASESVWVAKFKGNVREEIVVLVIGHENMLILSGDVVEKQGYKSSPELMMRLLRLNDEYDRVKVGIGDDGEIFVRIDLSLRVVDAREFKENLDQISAAVDEIYGAIKPHLVPVKK